MNPQHLPPSLRRILQRIERLIATASAPRLSDEQSLLALYLDHCRHEIQMTPQSLRQQYYYLRYILRWYRDRDPSFPAHTDTADIEAFLEFQREVKANSLTQQRHYLNTFRRFFALLLDEGLLDADPTRPLRLKTPQIRNIRNVLSLPQLNRLLETARGYRDQAPPRHRHTRIRDTALIGLLAATGCRLSEALALVRSQIGLLGEIVFPGKGDRRHVSRERVVPLADRQVRQDLRLWLSRRPGPPDTLVFVSSSGQPLEPHFVQQKLHQLSRLAGLDRKVTPHGLRATFASRLVENGIDPVALQQLLGHGHLRTTLTLYVKLDVKSLQRAWRRSNPLAAFPTPDHE